jgi:prevent-host-death family protein
MKSAVSAADANRKFSEILRKVREGHHFVVTSHGRPVARILPFGPAAPAETGARGGLIKRLRGAPVSKAGRWTRDELYEDER